MSTFGVGLSARFRSGRKGTIMMRCSNAILMSATFLLSSTGPLHTLGERLR